MRNLYNRPVYAVDALSALDCQAPADCRVGDHCSCGAHRTEVVQAYYAEDTNLVIHDVDPGEGYVCGDTYASKAVTR